MARSILALDLATQMGWCEGAPGEAPIYGSHRLAPVGSDPAAVLGGLLEWMALRIKVSRPAIVIFEAPLIPGMGGMKGKSNPATSRLLMGLVGVAEAVCYRMGVHDVREANVQDVRKHFIGRRTVPGGGAKREVMRRCRLLGYEPQDDNAGDAIALWDYQSSLLNPRVAAASTPLFGGSR